MLERHLDPIVAMATAPGRGAVGIVRVSGRGLQPFVQALLGRRLKPRHATYLPFSDAQGQPLDHGLALFFPAPHSYSGEDVLELQAHGGPVVLQLLLARCLEVAARPAAPDAAAPDAAAPEPSPSLPRLRLAQPGEFTERAYLNGRLDLAQAEAVADLIDASTEAAARSASRSLSGVFSQAVQALREGLVRLRMLVEATLDFPEEDIDFIEQADARGQLRALQEQREALLAQARQGALLQEGIRVVIAGQPNAGKSSLLNALAGAELAIVTPIAGTTRDKVSQTIQMEGVPVHVVDTAGLRDSQDTVEQIGIERAWGEVAQADVVLFLRDLSRLQDPISQAAEAAIEQQIAQRLGHSATPVLTVWNKVDASPQASPPADPVASVASAAPMAAMAAMASDASDAHGPVAQTPQAPALAPLRLSALTGEGLSELRQTLLRLAGWQPAASEGLFSARARHLQALQGMGQHLDQAQALLQAPHPALDLLAEELRLAQNALNQITGEFGADELLGEIFSRFCIGK